MFYLNMLIMIVLLICPNMMCIVFSRSADSGENEPSCKLEDTLAFFDLLHDKNISSIPEQDTGGLTNILFELVINDMYSLNEKALSLNLLLTVNASWTDSRLILECLLDDGPLVVHRGETVHWRPEYVLTPVRQAAAIRSPAEVNYFVIVGDGSVQWVLEQEVQIACHIDFSLFPFDDMYCRFTIAPPAHENEDNYHHYKLIWGNVSVSEWLTFQSHAVSSIEVVHHENSRDEGTCTINMRRFITFYILAYYVPNILTVHVAWVSFFLDPNSAPARASLGVTSLLALMLQYSNVLISLPQVGYVKAIDVWVVVCSTFISYSLLEFAYISAYYRGEVGSRFKKGPAPPIDLLSRRFYPAFFGVFMIGFFSMMYVRGHLNWSV